MSAISGSERDSGASTLKKKNSKKHESALISHKKHVDMDEAEHLSGYDRRQVAVPRTCDCGDDCRYHRYVRDCSSDKYLFQICNHNLLLADAMPSAAEGIISSPLLCAHHRRGA